MVCDLLFFSMQLMAPALIIVHGGDWVNNTYQGGTKDYIPIPHSGMRYIDFLSKLQRRLKKDRSTHIFEIDALVKVDEGETMRMRLWAGTSGVVCWT